MAIYKRDIVDINLESGNIHRTFLAHTIGYKDQKADHFGVRVFRDGEAVSLTGVSVQGVFMPPQGSPIAITSGNIVSGNTAEVVLPQACYDYNGQFCLAIKLVDSSNSVTGTVRIVDGVVDNTHASGTVAPTSAVPTYQEVLSAYEQAIAVIGSSVRFDTTQSLTAAQKTTARGNIDAASTDDVSSLMSAMGDYIYIDRATSGTIEYHIRTGKTYVLKVLQGSNVKISTRVTSGGETVDTIVNGVAAGYVRLFTPTGNTDYIRFQIANASIAVLGEYNSVIVLPYYTDKEINDLKNLVGSTPMGTSATTITGAIAEHESDLIEQKSEIDAVEKETDEIPGFFSKNICNPDTIVTGKFIKGSDGSAYAEDTNANFSYCIFDVEEGKSYIVSGTSYYFYRLDNDGVIISHGGNTTNTANRVISVSAGTGCKKVAVSFSHSEYPEATYMICEGTEMPSSYEPYNRYLFANEAKNSIEDIVNGSPSAGSSLCYVSTTGNDSNDGLSEATAFATFQHAIDAGFKKIIALSGDYSNQQISISNKQNITITCKSSGRGSTPLDTHQRIKKAAIDNSITVESLTENSSVYRAALDVTSDSNYYKVFISHELDPVYSGSGYYGRVTTYNAILWEECADILDCKRLVPKLTLSECQNTAGSFFYDGEYIYINPTGGSISGKTYKRMNVETDGIGITIIGSQNIEIEGIAIKYFPSSSMSIDGSSNVKIRECDSLFTCYSNGFTTNNSNVLFESCNSARAGADGYGIKGYGNVDLINCNGIGCYDDGVSHHDYTTGTIDGGEWAHCYKGGVTPAYGSNVAVKNVYCHNNPYGIYYVAEDGSRHTDNVMMIGNSLSINNTTRDIEIDYYNAVVFGCVYGTKNNTGGTVGDYGNTVIN